MLSDNGGNEALRKNANPEVVDGVSYQHGGSAVDPQHDSRPHRPHALAPFHTRMVLALGVAWVLDGLEITIVSALGAVLSERTP